MADFEAFPKIPRLRRDAVYTEKIDGTNACVVVEEFQFGEHVDGVPSGARLVLGPNDDTDGLPTHEYLIRAQSRKRFITPDQDNFGFAAWVHENAEDLVRVLGPGRHFGEWWGKGIQRGYDMPVKRFSLFNTSRWGWLDDNEERRRLDVPEQLHVVPVLSQATFSTAEALVALERLVDYGSEAAPGFMNPEGIVVYHTAANQMFKYTIENDDEGKDRGQVKRAA